MIISKGCEERDSVSNRQDTDRRVRHNNDLSLLSLSETRGSHLGLVNDSSAGSHYYCQRDIKMLLDGNLKDVKNVVVVRHQGY